MKKISYVIIFLIIFIGNKNYIELNNLAIITNISIVKEKENYKVTFQEIIPKREDNKVVKNFKYYTNTSNSLQHAFYNLEEDVTKEVYLEHLENIIIKTDDVNIIYDLNKFLKSDLDNFNIILSETDPVKILDYNNSYKYVNNLIKDNITLRSIKKAKLENKKIKIPIVKIDKNKRLIFYKYDELGGNNNA